MNKKNLIAQLVEAKQLIHQDFMNQEYPDDGLALIDRVIDIIFNSNLKMED